MFAPAFITTPLSSSNGHAPVDPVTPEPEKKAKPVHKPTEDELRDRFIQHYPTIFYGLGEWKKYEEGSGIFTAVPTDEVEHNISGVIEAAKHEGIRPTSHMVSSVARMVQRRVSVPDNEWNADPDILIVANGALRLSTRTLQKHSHRFKTTTALSFPYDPEAQCGAWHYALDRNIGEAQDMLQEFAGLALTKETKHEISIWLVGERGSGKSTIIHGLQVMAGTLAGTLSLSDIEESRFALSCLVGKTLMVATEQPSMFIKASHRLNAIISGEKIRVEEKYIKAFDLSPHAKIIWAMNDAPRVADATSGIFRRVKVIEVPPLPPGERDVELKDRISREGPGILNWALDGLKRLQIRGRFDVPECVVAATEGFQLDNDVSKLFVEDECFTGADFTTKAGLLYAAYKLWHERCGYRYPNNTTKMAAEWKRPGFEPTRRTDGTYYKGVGLKAQD